MALNELLRDVEKRLTLAIANPHAPLQAYASLGEDTGMVVLTQ